MTTSVIEASALCRVFASEDGREPVRAVDGVTFAVPPEARLVALIGRGGAGKSTLMQMICGLVGQNSGSLSVLGRTPDPDDEDFVNAVGYMPQTLGLYKDLSVMENMKLFGALRGAKPPEDMTIEAYYASLIALTGLEGFEGRPAGKLSGGMKQKLAIIAAWIHDPKLIIMDEPFVGLDPKAAHLLKGMMRELCESAQLITPNRTEAALLAGCGMDAPIETLLKALTVENVIITGVHRGEEIGYCARLNGQYMEIFKPCLPQTLHGTGDVFVSALCGELMNGKGMPQALKDAAEFCDDCVQKTAKRGESHWYGLAFEDKLKEGRGL